MENLSFNFPTFEEFRSIDYKGSFWNEDDIGNLNKTLIKTALNLKEINTRITKYERELCNTTLNYKRKYRRTLLNASGKTETQKKIIADIECEDLEAKKFFLEEVIKELTRISMELRTELDILKTLGHNMRQELRL